METKFGFGPIANGISGITTGEYAFRLVYVFANLKAQLSWGSLQLLA